jgi:TorA maturation chaperone TorD
VVGAARAASDEAIADEYEALFGGVGKPEIYLYGSHYLGGFLNEKPLARLRTTLGELGLARAEAMGDTEDHISYLCEVMRYLIAGDDVAVANLTRQRAFFSEHLQPWAQPLCEAIKAHPKAKFYAVLADFTSAFVSVEAQGFDMLQ